MQIFYLFGQAPKIILLIITFILNIHSSVIDSLNVISTLIAIIMRGSNIIVFYCFNKLYRKILKEYAKTIINIFIKT